MADEYGAFMGFGGAGETALCHYSLRLDPYGKGCVHNCAYCYARAALDFRHMWNADRPSEAPEEALRRKLETVLSPRARGRVGAAVQAGVPIRIGSMSDGFPPTERERGLTLAALRVLQRYGHPVLIMTKSTMIAEPDYLDTLDPCRSYVQVSFSTLDDDVAAKLENGAPPPSARLKAMEEIRKRGVYVAARYCPYMPPRSDVGGDATITLDWSSPADVRPLATAVTVSRTSRRSPLHRRRSKPQSARCIVQIERPLGTSGRGAFCQGLDAAGESCVESALEVGALKKDRRGR